MRVFRKVLFGLLCAVDVYFTYSWIGYLVLGIKHPVIYGETNTNFMGMYIMSITFFVLFALLSGLLLVWGILYIKESKKRKNIVGTNLDSSINAIKNENSFDDNKVEKIADEIKSDIDDNAQNQNTEVYNENGTENKENGEIL